MMFDVVPSAPPDTDELRDLVHALREPVGAFAIRASLLDDQPLTVDGRQQLEAMIADVKRMADALARITARFQLEVGGSLPVPMVSQRTRGHGHPRSARAR